jgi:hypothetical protein
LGFPELKLGFDFAEGAIGVDHSELDKAAEMVLGERGKILELELLNLDRGHRDCVLVLETLRIISLFRNLNFRLIPLGIKELIIVVNFPHFVKGLSALFLKGITGLGLNYCSELLDIALL